MKNEEKLFLVCIESSKGTALVMLKDNPFCEKNVESIMDYLLPKKHREKIKENKKVLKAVLTSTIFITFYSVPKSLMLKEIVKIDPDDDDDNESCFKAFPNKNELFAAISGTYYILLNSEKMEKVGMKKVATFGEEMVKIVNTDEAFEIYKTVKMDSIRCIAEVKAAEKKENNI